MRASGLFCLSLVVFDAIEEVVEFAQFDGRCQVKVKQQRNNPSEMMRTAR